jgi:hypothetical protein
VKNKIVFLLLLATSLYAEPQSPVHGVYWSNQRYADWKNDGSPVFGEDQGDHTTWPFPYINRIDGRAYLTLGNLITISNTIMSPTDGGSWKILSSEENGNRVVFHLESLLPARFLPEGTGGTVTVILVDEDTIYFESYEGNDDFSQEIRVFPFGPEHLLHRVVAEE